LQVKCKKCNRIMQAEEVMTHVGIYLLSRVAPALEDILIKLIQAQLVSSTRSCFDNVLAALANSIAIECSDCKNKGCWNPYPVIENTQEESDPDNITIR
jgi:hypothetical protein